MTQDNTFGYLWLLSYNELYALQYTEEGTLVSVDIHDLVDTHMMYTKIMKDREGICGWGLMIWHILFSLIIRRLIIILCRNLKTHGLGCEYLESLLG